MIFDNKEYITKESIQTLIDVIREEIDTKADTSSLATVATTGEYSDLNGTPSLSTVATSGSYDDLSNKPTIDTALSTTSTNAVQNKVITGEINDIKTTIGDINTVLEEVL